MFWLLGFFLQKEKHWLGQHHLSVWTLWTLLSPPRYSMFLHLTLETQLCRETRSSQGETPGCTMPGPWSRLGSLSASRERARTGSGELHLPSQQPQRARPSALIQSSPSGLLGFTPAHSMGNASLGVPGEPSSPAAAEPHEPTETAWCWHTESCPLLPSAGDKLLLSPECSLTCRRAAGPARALPCACTESFTKGEYNKHSVTAFGNRQKLFARPLPLGGQCSLCPC